MNFNGTTHGRLLESVIAMAVVCAASHTLQCRAAEPRHARLPLTIVSLFSSGVGYFQLQGEVEGDSQIELQFAANDINDLLKSMVLQDLDGGRISTVTYGSKDPIAKTLKTFSIDLSEEPTIADLLRQIRGERITVDAPQPIRGQILGIEQRVGKPAGEENVASDYLNLATDEGLKTVPLSSVVRIQLLEEKLNDELREALKLLASEHATDKKTVRLEFVGAGKRRVRVGYIQESPVWKTTYRLVLDEENPPFLQGWAIVENTSDEDWNRVALSLVSGRPVSYVMDLYEPLYVARPVVEPELFGSLAPRSHDQDLAGKADGRKTAGARPRNQVGAGGAGFGFGAGGFGGMAGGGQPSMPEPPAEATLNLNQGVQTAASAEDVGELFQYKIDLPVSLPRQQSAMLPIVNVNCQGHKLSIYNPAVHAKHPLNGFQLVNTSGVHLMQGPITVFDGGSYAGDARIDDVAPSAKRLISYALDLETEVTTQSKNLFPQLTTVKLVKGVLHSTRRTERIHEYLAKNTGKQAKKLIIEQPWDPNWKLLEPQTPAEKSRDLYRFEVAIGGGDSATLDVREEQNTSEETAIGSLDDGAIQIYTNDPKVSDRVKTALTEILRRKQELSALMSRKISLDARIRNISEEQSRIRQNMQQLDRTADLYKRYVQILSEQEGDIAKIRMDAAALEDQETQQRLALDQFLLSLDIE